KHLSQSSTYHIRSEMYHFPLGINYEYTNMQMLHSVVGELIPVGEQIHNETEAKDEPLEGRLEELFEAAVDFVVKPMLYMHKQDRVEMIRYLNEKGTFSIHKSIPFIACKMNVSRYTVYNYILEIKVSLAVA